jgi:peroxiredoxin
MHGDAFNEGPRQAAYLMGGTGKVHFPVTTRSRDAQKFFDQGVGQLHGFWYFEAERSFRQVAALDPDCAMAFWGMAMANVNNAKRARGFIEKAVTLKARASPREQAWIDALADFRKDDKRSDKDRRTAYLAALEKIAKAHPDDLEAKAFWAVAQWESSSKGVPIKDKHVVNRLLQDIFDRQPLHPANHYRIHLWDESRATNALASAAANGASAPATAHMWHMSGHTYSKLNRFSDAAWQQEASARTDHAYMMKNRVMPDQIHNFAHNNEWLIRDLNHIGAVRDAVDLAKNMTELPRHPAYNTLTKGSASFGYQRLIETLVRYELWDELLVLSRTTYLEPVDDTAHATRRARALGLAHIHKGDLANGRAQINELAALKKKDDTRKAEEAKKKAAQKTPEKRDEEKVTEKPAEEAKPAQDKSDEGADSTKSGKGLGKTPSEPPSSPIENALAELQGWLALKEGDAKKAREWFTKSKDLPKERLAQIEFLLGDQSKAVKLAQEAAKSATNQVQPLASYVDLAYRSGRFEEAYTNFYRLRDLAAEVDLNAPVFQRLAPVAKDLDFSGDWKPRLQRAADFGKRPSLEKLGPFRWQPMPADDWTLPDSEGHKLSLRSFHGRPVVVIFFLGHGCGHCIQQLNAFAPVVRQFEDAGISLVAVSTDSVEGVRETFTKTDVKEKFPFPIVSDERLRVFKEYRCYDDFEKMPLHGTFLLDGSGLVRWQDISFQPFMETQFLLGEAKRLLGRTRVPLLAGGEE